MTGASKILTVSYGTFSCTLEGFDEPFNTMKAIAEYFRDLAADDRYFGAEPPTPDTAMLHRIAEREIQRKVEARVEDNSVILRAGDWVAGAGPAIAGAAAAVVPEAVADPVQDVALDAVADTLPEDQGAVTGADLADALPEDMADDDVTPELMPEVAEELPEAFFADLPDPEPAPKAERPQLADAMPEGVAAKLARLRQSVAASEPVTAAAAATMPEHFEDEHAATAPVADDLAEVFAAVADEEVEVEVEALAVVIAEVEITAEISVETAPEEEPEPEPEDDAGMLARLGGLLVDEGEVAGSVEPDMDDAAAEVVSDLAVAADMQADVDLADDDLAGLIATMAGGDTGSDSAPEETPVVTEAVNPFADEADFDDDDEVYTLAEEPDLPDLPELGGDLNDDLPEGLISGLVDDAADAADAMAQALSGETELAPAMAEESAPVAEAPAESASEAVEAAAEAVVAEKAQRARARVIKIRRADAMPAAETGAETAAEGMAVAAQGAPAEPKAAEGADDLARLLRQTDDEMSEPENQRRQSAIQHLKKAVAATVAERRAGVKEPSDEERADPYREDLARAVSPVRPRAVDGRVSPQRPVGRGADRPAAQLAVEADGSEAAKVVVRDRPAPLMLVSEQRIDRSAPLRVAPVRPRRMGGGGGAAAAVAATAFEQIADAELEAELEAAMRNSDAASDNNDADYQIDEDDDEDDDTEAGDAQNIFAASKGFLDFADRLGANGLPDMLEAAAAYATCVENREHFTRPLLMRRLENGEMGQPMSREDGLRSFGTLLREGRIEKIRRGHYALPEGSAVLAEARKLAP